MSAITVGNIRLAAGSDMNSVFYNAYHLLTQISALYAHFSLYAQSLEHKQIILSFGDEVVGDLGELYVVWDGLDKALSAEMPAGKHLSALMVRTCKQFATIIELSNEWTSFSKMASLLILSERRWRRILMQLIEGGSTAAPVLTELRVRGEGRGQRIARELQKSRIADRHIQNAFDTADRSLLEKVLDFNG